MNLAAITGLKYPQMKTVQRQNSKTPTIQCHDNVFGVFNIILMDIDENSVC